MYVTRRWTLVVASLAIAAFGCKHDARTSTIQSLLDDPSSHDKTIVRIAGEVTGSIGVMGYGAYTVADETGSISVVSKSGGAPRTHAHVALEGEFRSAYTLGDHTGAVIIEQRRRVE